MTNRIHSPGQSQVPIGSRTQPELPAHTPGTEEQELASVLHGGPIDHPDRSQPMPTGHPSGRTAGREDGSGVIHGEATSGAEAFPDDPWAG
jgi:hypothetical protein